MGSYEDRKNVLARLSALDQDLGLMESGSMQFDAVPISTRDALVLLLKAYWYPCNNLFDCRQAELAEAEALKGAADARASADDPPEFSEWLRALLAPNRTEESRDATIDAIYEYFESEGKRHDGGR